MAPTRWSVLLLGGPSGVGKTTAARTLAAQLGVAWLMVDDLRRALLHSQVTLPQRTEALSCFAHPLARTWPAHGLRAGLSAWRR